MNASSNKGFTLIEMVFILSIMGILVGIALPAYEDYLERAELAEVMLGFDGMATAARVQAAESGRGLCNWSGSNAGQPDEASRLIKQVVDRDLALLDPADWLLSASGLTLQNAGQGAALVIQYAGIGEHGVRRNELLASMFIDNGLFNQWHQRSASYAVFSVFLDHCKTRPAATTVLTGVTTSGGGQNPQPETGKTPMPTPVLAPTPTPVVTPTPVPTPTPGRIPVLVPTPDPKPPAGQSSTASTTGSTSGSSTAQAPAPVQHATQPVTSAPVLSHAQQVAQCMSNCRRIWPHGNSIMYRRCKASCRY